jgi:hypothetical protein
MKALLENSYKIKEEQNYLTKSVIKLNKRSY